MLSYNITKMTTITRQRAFGYRFLWPAYVAAMLFLLLIQIICIFVIKKKTFPKLTVLSLSDEQIFSSKSMYKTELFEFFSENRFSYNLKHSDQILVEYRKIIKPRTKKNIVFSRDLSSYYLTHLLGRRLAFKTLFSGAKSLLVDLTRVDFIGFNPKIMRTRYYKPLWQEINLQFFHKTHIVSTNSHLNSMHEALLVSKRRYETSMLWYSTNDVPFCKNGTHQQIQKNLNHLNEFIDTHYVWNEYQLINLTNRGAQHVKVVGSIIFRPQLLSIENKLKENRVVYFDVTPQDLESSFYTTAMAIKNIDDLIKSVAGISKVVGNQISLSLKKKRKYFHNHSRKYINYLAKLEAANKITILEPFVNLYDEIGRANIVIAMPFTSPALIALELGIPSIYYCGLDEGWNLGKEHYGCEVLRSPSELESKLIEIFRK